MENPPNVIVVMWDAVRASNTSLDGYERETTPNLVDIAKESVTFTETRATTSWTLPSHASIFTGLYPRQHGTTSSNLRFQMSDRHLATQLSNAGYTTGLFTSNTYLKTPTFGLSPEFDFVFSSPDDVPFQNGIDPDAFVKQHGKGSYIKFLQAAIAHNYPARSLLNGITKKIKEFSVDESQPVTREAELYINGFIDWVDQTDQPFFGFVNLMDAHAPYQPPEEYTEYVDSGYDEIPQTPPWLYLSEQEPAENLTTLQGLYDGCISYIDAQLGHLYRQLDERNLLEDTVVVITGDHGEAFGEQAEACRDGILYGHTLGVEEVLLRVPLVIRFPGAKHAGERVTDLVSLKDLYYTLLEESGVNSITDKTKLLYPDTPSPEWVFAEWDGFTKNAREGAARYDVDLNRYDQNMYAYYENETGDPVKYVTNNKGCDCAWHLKNDSVRENITSKQFDMVQNRFNSRIDKLEGKSKKLKDDVEISKKTRKDLENLGYI